MGDVVQLRDFRFEEEISLRTIKTDALVPVEFGVGLADRQQCLLKIAELGIRRVEVHQLKGQSGASLCMMSINDAIWLNKKLLECEELSDAEIAERIDWIQMLENSNPSMLEAMWKAFTVQYSVAAFQAD